MVSLAIQTIYPDLSCRRHRNRRAERTDKGEEKRIGRWGLSFMLTMIVCLDQTPNMRERRWRK
jgi:hypothetical protein